MSPFLEISCAAQKAFPSVCGRPLLNPLLPVLLLPQQCPSDYFSNPISMLPLPCSCNMLGGCHCHLLTLLQNRPGSVAAHVLISALLSGLVLVGWCCQLLPFQHDGLSSLAFSDRLARWPGIAPPTPSTPICEQPS